MYWRRESRLSELIKICPREARCTDSLYTWYGQGSLSCKYLPSYPRSKLLWPRCGDLTSPCKIWCYTSARSEDCHTVLERQQQPKVEHLITWEYLKVFMEMLKTNILGLYKMFQLKILSVGYEVWSITFATALEEILTIPVVSPDWPLPFLVSPDLQMIRESDWQILDGDDILSCEHYTLPSHMRGAPWWALAEDCRGGGSVWPPLDCSVSCPLHLGASASPPQPQHTPPSSVSLQFTVYSLQSTFYSFFYSKLYSFTTVK